MSTRLAVSGHKDSAQIERVILEDLSIISLGRVIIKGVYGDK